MMLRRFCLLLLLLCSAAIAEDYWPAFLATGTSELDVRQAAALLGCTWEATPTGLVLKGDFGTVTCPYSHNANHCVIGPDGTRHKTTAGAYTFGEGFDFVPARAIIAAGKGKLSWNNAIRELTVMIGDRTETIPVLTLGEFFSLVPIPQGGAPWSVGQGGSRPGEDQLHQGITSGTGPVLFWPPAREAYPAARGGASCPQGGNHVPGKVDANGRLHCAKCGQFMRSGTTSVPAAQLRAAPAQAGDRVNVRGYYRKDGTYVRPHTRSRPRK